MRAITFRRKTVLGAVLLSVVIVASIGVITEASSLGATPKETLIQYYTPEPVDVTPSVRPYSLPLSREDIANFNRVISVIQLSFKQEALLKQNGFVAIPWGDTDDIVAPYKYLKKRNIPIFVTSDTLLHIYHFLFNDILANIEEQEFFAELLDLSRAVLIRAEADYAALTDPLLKEAARRNVAYFAVPLRLLGVDFAVPSYVQTEVNTEIAHIDAHAGFAPSAIFNSNTVCKRFICYCEDYSQYVPRGHYTRSERLKRYFKAMMWYGRMAFLLKGGLLTEENADIATIQAAMIASELPQVTVGSRSASDIWKRIYSVTAFFVGVADDLTPYEYLTALNSVFGPGASPTQLTDPGNLLKFKIELAGMRSPRIYGGTGVCVINAPSREALYECLDKTKGMRFMGQRFVPDSYIFQNLVYPDVGDYTGSDAPFTMCITGVGRRERCLPRGLDVMATLGSTRAYAILKQEGDTSYAGYLPQLRKLQREFAALDVGDWNRNLYWGWLYALEPLLREFPSGYPTFMRTSAWEDKELNTALSSWTELRHDTILYAKQSYTPKATVVLPSVIGYVEPVPELYARLHALTEMTEAGLRDLNVLDQGETARLRGLEGILSRLTDIAKKELAGVELSDDDYRFIQDFGELLEEAILKPNSSLPAEPKGMETTLVADVHTDTNTGQVLEEAVGYANLLLVAYRSPDGQIILAAGPVLSHYEFKHPMRDRLTDEAWKEMLQTVPPSPPAWTSSYLNQGG